MINPTEVNSLIKLLDDPDGEIFEHVHDKLKSYGSEVIEYLEGAFEEAFDPIQQDRIANLVHGPGSGGIALQSQRTGAAFALRRRQSRDPNRDGADAILASPSNRARALAVWRR